MADNAGEKGGPASSAARADDASSKATQGDAGRSKFAAKDTMTD
jgi:hypothetical protein